jgi:hypothetical protein
MKNLLYLILLIAVVADISSCGESKQKKERQIDTVALGNGMPKETKIEFAYTTYDFGEIVQGEVVKHSFSFTNTGDAPLIISNANASCGCTVPSYPKEPLAPGEKGEIVVQFNSAGKMGPQNKSVSITANTVPSITILILKGTIKPDTNTSKENPIN